jgi:phosphoribulokinase
VGGKFTALGPDFRRWTTHDSDIALVITQASDHLLSYDRMAMRKRVEEELAEGNYSFSYFGPDSSLFTDLEQLFENYSGLGSRRFRKYLHDGQEAERYDQQAGTFAPWEDLPADTDLLFHEGLHGAIKTETEDVASHVDQLIGVVPVINLEWIQKLHRDKLARGYSTGRDRHHSPANA